MEGKTLGEHRKFLVVDDSSFARKMCGKSMHELCPDAEIVEACDGIEALKCASDATFDLMIVDFNMPGDNGIEVAGKLKAIDADANIVLCTANIQQGSRDSASELGIGFIAKPINTEKLKQYVSS